MGSFGLTSRDLSVVSDLKTVLIPCCSRLRWRVSETPLMYGSTVVDLNSAVFLSGAGFLVLVTFCKKDEGYPLATRAVDRCFFSWAVPDGLVGKSNFCDVFFKSRVNITMCLPYTFIVSLRYRGASG